MDAREETSPLEVAARDLRELHRLSQRRPRDLPLWAQLDAIGDWIARARSELQTDVPPALEKVADWLLDNDYVIESALRGIRRDLPSGFYARLAALEGGELGGLPRAFSLARAALVASRLQLSLDGMIRFIDAYQADGEALSIAELWALPPLLRIACLELLLGALARLAPGASAPATLRALPPAPEGFDDADCVARAIVNLRVIDGIEWKDFFQRVSRVERVLSRDPAGVYLAMDFETRDRYRRRIERLAAAAGCTETRLAERVVEQALAQRGRAGDLDHVGHWLIGAGADEFARLLDCRLTVSERARALLRERAAGCYALALAAATAAAVVVPNLVLAAEGAGLTMRILGVAAAVLPASFVSFGLVHWLITLVVPPDTLPKLDFRQGIPKDCRTVVAVPALAGSEAEARELVSRLEEHLVANPDPALDFALLTDWPDASQSEPNASEVAALAALRAGVRALNGRWGEGASGPFHLLHRERRFNPREGCWMGWERKRGKLEELNHLLAGEPSEAFVAHEGDDARLVGIRFVITLDADTRLPPGAAHRLVGTLAHPLNRARFDAASSRAVRGYTVIQPRVEISPQAGNRTTFSRLYAGDTSIDIYTHAVSDVYQDLFGSGIFVGKGIYEVATFRQSLAGRVPDDALASHDLFEGVHGRAGLASDIVLYEGFPSRYESYARRWHRWVRGDWQLLPWLGRRVPGPGGLRLPNRLSWLDRWKLLDNLRRSVLPPALVVLLVAGWVSLPGSVWAWTALVVLAPAVAIFIDVVTGFARGRRRGAVHGALRSAANHAGHWFLAITFLANDALVACDAIARTLWRLAVSHRRLLEWTAAADVEARLASDGARARTWRALVGAPVLAAALGAIVAIANPGALLAAAPLLLLWIASPEIAFLLGGERRDAREALTADDAAWLRKLARRTWLYFETLVGPGDHWLPPDNLQERPHRTLAHRTSPTNIGMGLLSTLTATDLGYVDLVELDLRLRSSIDTLERLPRHRGHIFNWYDTRSLVPLEPRYVSTVDSGNLAVCLVTLRAGIEELVAGPAQPPQAWLGLRDALLLLADALRGVPAEASAELEARTRALALRAAEAAAFPDHRAEALARLCGEAVPELERGLASALDYTALSTEELREIHTWLERALHQAVAMRLGAKRLAPWTALLGAPPPERAALARALAELLPPSLSLQETPERCEQALSAAAAAAESGDAEATRWDADLRSALEQGAKECAALAASLRRSAERAGALAWAMDFRLLYDTDTRRFRIGYNASVDRFDANHYDLLASEARLASFFSIAKGDVLPEHWFHLGRPLARTRGRLVLVSWGGSMFEYLMPPLLLRSEPGTLLAQSERAAVRVQRRWAQRLGIPWGASESAFASFDPSGSYRYQSFGAPGLGLRRGLARDRVVAPYASALALPIRLNAAIRNLRTLESLGLMGQFGFVDAADFTPERNSGGRKFTPVLTYMAHHQGMTLAALGNALCGDALVRRFHADVRMRSAELLLHERIPHELPPAFEREEESLAAPVRTSATLPPAWSPAGVHGAPRLHALGNGRLASWISAAGGGALHWQGLAITRWRPDATRDASGHWLYLRDAASGEVWSIGRQPTGRGADDARATFHPHFAELHRREHGIAARMDVAVASADDVEIRLLTLANETDVSREIVVTSAAEVALAPPLDDERHPAFSKLFIHSEWLPACTGLLFTRRARHPGEPSVAALHRLVADDPRVECVAHEGDRAAFLGRGGSARRPLGVTRDLTGTTGFTLDPLMALQVRVALGPYECCRLAFLTFASGSRESVLEAASRYETLASLEWGIADAGGEVARELQRVAIPGDALPHLQALGSLLLAPCGTLGASPADRARNLLGQARLWGRGVSGDLPIVLLKAADLDGSDLMRLLIRALAYWRQRGIAADLVIVRSGGSSYGEALREQVHAALRDTGASAALGQRGGVHLVFADQVQEEELRLLACCAQVVLDDSRGSLADQLAAAPPPPPELPALPGVRRVEGRHTPELARPTDLLFDNGLGGFTPDGREYVIHLERSVNTPVPWSNILANENFGCLITESGGGFTWSVNSGENRLTAWSNDPVCDSLSEVLYLRDEETGESFSITPRPAGGDSACQVRHGAGYTRWRRQSHELDQELAIFVPAVAPVKIARVELRNLAQRPRRITATYWAEWLLGSLESVARRHVVCSWETGASALLARNAWNADFAARVAFLTATLPAHGITSDRREFLGPEGDLATAAALGRWGLSGRVEPGADAGAAYQVHIDLAAGASARFSFVLGQGGDRSDALALAAEWREPARIERARAALDEHWDRLLGAVQVRTPDPALNLLVNRWLPYQTLSSRLFARAGFYQASGAFGFRDQLQDVLALLHIEPQRARDHLLLCASHQFEAGDVLHWWHPPADRGVRTRCSDDMLWLPYAVSCYVEATGDDAVLEERVRFLRGPELAPHERDRYARFESAAEATLFEHCRRALERGVTSGRHGLPRIGSGDWNDGFDRLGERGEGESVWLGWFAFDVMNRFAGLCDRRGERVLGAHWRSRAHVLNASLETAAWDGAWWRRAFDDDGRALGSHENTECRIDSVTQSWAVLSGAQLGEKSRIALASAIRELVQGTPPLARLFWPPFATTPREPGYVKAYPPGVRENGGQYNHAAAWLAWALSRVGENEAASFLLDAMSPIRRSCASVIGYRGEPYVFAGDIASDGIHAGRSGWTWYTGSAAWVWRFVVEQMLGLQRESGRLVLRPQLPPSWEGFEAVVRDGDGVLNIRVRVDDGVAGALTVDGAPVPVGGAIPFPATGKETEVELVIDAVAPSEGIVIDEAAGD